MNKKGFTLVELLSVIIILALLVLIVGTGVTRLVKNSREKLSNSQLVSIEEAAKVWGIENIEFMPEDGECIYITLGYLKDYGVLDDSVVDAKTSGELSDELLVKITNESSQLGIPNIKYEAGVTDVTGCTLRELKYSTLVTGSEFNAAVKTLVNGTTMAYSSADTKITKLEFYSIGKMPEGYTKETLTALSSVDVSENQDDSVIAYHNGNGEVYIYSENRIFANSNSNTMFTFFTKVSELNIADLDTSNVTTMRSLFGGCASLKELDLSSFDTSKVIDMYGMFIGTTAYQMQVEKIIGIEDLDVSKVENMQGMFQHCIGLDKLDLSNWDTSSVTNFSYMFNNNLNLEKLNINGWDTSSANNMSYMFQGCSNLVILDLSSFNTSNVTNFQQMFWGCSVLTEIKGIENLDTSNVKNMAAIFKNCSSLTKLNLLNWNTKNVSTMQEIFQNDFNLTCIQVGKNWTIENVENTTNMFSNAGTSSVTTGYCIATIDYLSNTTTGTTADETFYNGTLNRSKIEKIITVASNTVPSDALGSWNISENGNIKAWYYDADGDNLYELYIGQNGGVKAAPDSSRLFAYFTNVTEMDLSNLDTSHTTTLYLMFNKCTSLTTLNLNTFDTSGITSTRLMFQNCTSLKSLYINEWDTSNVETMYGMFKNCNNLKNLDLSNLNTSKVTSMNTMFMNCTSLTTLDLSSFDTSKVTDMTGMFASDAVDNPMAFTSITGLEKFDTSSVTTTKAMFQGCSNLTSLNISSWNTTKVTDMSYMFNRCSSLTTLNLSGWNTSKVTDMSYMFNKTTNIGCISVGSGWTIAQATTTDMFVNSGVSTTQTDSCTATN